MKSYTDIEQSRKLAEILPLESADMFYILMPDGMYNHFPLTGRKNELSESTDIPCWSLSALLDVFPEINGIPLTLEKVKAEDGYEGYYYHIEYKSIVLIPYSKNPIDACYKMVEYLHKLNLL